MLVQAALPFAADEPERARDVVSAIIEISLLTWFFYALLKFLHGKAGLSVLKGLLITIIGIFLGLATVQYALGISFPRLQVAGTYMLPFMIVVLVVLFQPELRRGLLRLSEAGSMGGRGSPGHVADLCTSFRALARRHTGALVVFERQTGIKGLQDTGVPLDAAVSGALLESVFYPKSPLHDGAVIVRDGRIVAACCMLPLTESTALSRELGTRHRAAIGVTEESDAVAVVVSEETGHITVAHRGLLTSIEDVDELEEMLTDLLGGGMLEEDAA
jgi:diadenylate cyclase